MRSNAAKKHQYESVPATPSRKAHLKVVDKQEPSQAYDEITSIDYEEFLMQYGIRSDFA